MKQTTEQELQKQCDQFNQSYKIGDRVEVFKIKGRPETFEDEIKNEATILGGHTAMTWLKEKGCYDLTFVKGKINY